MADQYDPQQAAEALAGMINALVGGHRTETGATSEIDPETGLPRLGSASGTAGTGGALSGDFGGGSELGNRDQDAFYVAVLKGLGAPVSEGNMQLMRAWNQAEGMDAGHHNPFATTQYAEGARSLNSVNVRSYASFESGVQATIETLTNGMYQGVLDGLQASDPGATAAAIANSHWGTGSLVQRVLGSNVQTNTDAYYTPEQVKAYLDEVERGRQAAMGADAGFPVM